MAIGSSRVFKIILYIGVFVFFGFLAFSGLFYWMANRTLPPAQEFKSLSIKKPKRLTFSAKWERLLQSNAFLVKIPASAQKAHAAIKEGRWPTQVEEFKLAMTSLQAQYWTILQTFRSKGCYFRDDFDISAALKGGTPKEVFARWQDARWSRIKKMISALRIFVLYSVKELQSGDAERATKEMLVVEKRLAAYLDDCAITPQDAFGLIYLLGRLHHYLAIALVHPHLSSETRVKIFQALRRWQKRPRFMNALIYRHTRLLYRMIAHLKKQPDYAWIPAPWSDASDTRTLLQRYARRYVFISQTSIRNTTAWRISPIEALLARTRTQSKLLRYYQYNAVGRFLMSQIPVEYRNVLISWYKMQCQFAAFRALLVSKLKEGGIEMPEGFQAIKPIDPFTNQEIKLPFQNICVLSSAYQVGVSNDLMGGVVVGKVPAIPQLPEKDEDSKEKK